MSFTTRTPFDWHLRTCMLALGPRTLIMGILNVTPDSFSDGGLHYSPELSPDRAVEHAAAMLDEGADILDIGGESTRPGAGAVRAEEEQARILPVIEAVLRARPEAILSVDTYHADTARRALDCGVEIVNDVSGLMWDPAMAAVVAEAQAGLVMMHARGTPGQWATLPALALERVLPTVIQGLTESLRLAHAAGVDRGRVVIDPGFGFGKRGDENFTLHAELSRLQELRYPMLVGTSRKRFLTAHLLGGGSATRLSASTASNVAAVLAGAHLVRAHDVAAARAACSVADAILCGRVER